MKPTVTRIEILRVLQEIASMPGDWAISGDWTMSGLRHIMLKKDLYVSQTTLTNVLNTFNNKNLISRYVNNEGIVTYRISNITSPLE